MSVKDLKILLDYITNLQQENETRQQENETRQQDINNLTYQLAKEKEERHELLDYKSRCEKASDNLKRNYWIKEHEHNDDVVNMTLNILQNGSDS